MKITQSINNENLPTRDVSDIKILVHHHTGSSNDSQNFLNRTDYISCHYLIKKTGEIVQLVADDRIAYHAGKSSYNGFESKGDSLNWCSIGIEVEGGARGRRVDDFTDNQRESLMLLTAHLNALYGIKKVLRHKDISPDRKVDPYDTLYNNRFDELYNQNYMIENDKYVNEKEAPGLLTKLTGENALKEKDIKALINIAINRLKKELGK